MEQATLASVLMDEKDMQRALKRISHQIVESQHGCEGLVLLGIYRRGVPLAQRIAEYIEQNEGVRVPVGKLDITRHRDDLDTLQHLAESISRSEVPCDLTGAHVVLVDDVFYTGRTIRAAMDAVMERGRAATIQLAVLIDRGHRELPIRADFVGKNVPSAYNEKVKVRVMEIDGKNCVELLRLQ